MTTNTPTTDDEQTTTTPLTHQTPNAPHRSNAEEISAFLADFNTPRGIVLSLAVGIVLGVVFAGWAIQSIAIPTGATPEMYLRIGGAFFGGLSMVGAKIIASLAAGYVLVAMGVTVDRPL